MRKREENPFGKELSPQTLSLSEIWSALTSEVGSILGETSTATSLDGSTIATAKVTMPTTVKVSVPVSTVTVDRTVLQTSFTTLRVTTHVVQQPSTTSLSSSINLPSIKSGNKSTSLPAVLSGISSSTTPSSTLSHETHQPISTPISTPSTTANANTTSHTTRKHAIIGGLSGSIAGLVLIGVLICFCLRRRRKHRDDGNDEVAFDNEKGLRPVLARKWSEITATKTSPRPPLPVSRGSTTPDLDGHVIRMSLEHWPRPFLHGEGFRESVGPGQLRVMNPDPSRPTTPGAPPRPSAESPAGFLKRQRSALAVILLGAGTGRSRASSRADSPQRSTHLPSIEIERATSPDRERGRERAASNAAPSVRSYSSAATLRTVHQHPLEDPFLTPPDESPVDMPEAPPQARTRRPSLAPLQSAAGVASRTLSHLSNSLNPFRSKSDLAAESMRSVSRQSFSTFSSAGDPFKLDRPSIRGSIGGQGGRTASEYERQQPPNLMVYEGT